MNLTLGLKLFTQSEHSTHSCPREISESLLGDHFQSRNATDKQSLIESSEAQNGGSYFGRTEATG